MAKQKSSSQPVGQAGENAQYKKPVEQPAQRHITTYKEYQSTEARLTPRWARASRPHRKYRQ
ncbi:hypothetical protein, partial [Aeromonas sp. 25-AL00135]